MDIGRACPLQFNVLHTASIHVYCVRQLYPLPHLGTSPQDHSTRVGPTPGFTQPWLSPRWGIKVMPGVCPSPPRARATVSITRGAAGKGVVETHATTSVQISPPVHPGPTLAAPARRRDGPAGARALGRATEASTRVPVPIHAQAA